MIQKKPNLKLAVCLMILASIMYAVAGLFLNFIGNNVSTIMIVFVRFGFSLIILLPWLLKDTQLFKISNPRRIFYRSICSIISLSCMFYALKYISLADGLLLNNTSALFVPIAAFVMLKAKTSIKIWLSIILGFIGVIFILNPDKKFLELASLVGLISGIIGGFTLVQIRQLSKVNSTQQILFYYFLTGTLVSGVLIPFVWQTPLTSTWWQLLWVGVSSTLYQISIVLAYSYGPVRILSSLMFMSVICGAIFDLLLFGIVPDINSIIGMILIIIGCFGSIYFGLNLVERKKNEEYRISSN